MSFDEWWKNYGGRTHEANGISRCIVEAAFEQGLKEAADIARNKQIENVVMYPKSRIAIAEAIEAEISE